MINRWTERSLARALFWHVFHGKHLVVVPNCQWPGSECDLLVVRRDLRLVDVEIKLTRADLKADAIKEKWFEIQRWRLDEPWVLVSERARTARSHPTKIWKHYYAVPEKIWKPELLTTINPASGVLLIGGDETCVPFMRVERQAKAAKDAEKISGEALCDIARLSSVRMWRAFDEIDQSRLALARST